MAEIAPTSSNRRKARQTIRFAILTAVALIIVAGTLIGLLLGVGTAAVLAAFVSHQTGVALSANVGAPELWLALAFVAAGLLLALVPAWLSARGSPMEALTNA